MLKILVIIIFMYSSFISSEESGWDVYFSDLEWAGTPEALNAVDKKDEAKVLLSEVA